MSRCRGGCLAKLTVTGLSDETVCIGDRFRIGTAEVVVTQPRVPCYKLGLKFGRDDMVKRFLASERTGFYLRVIAEGEVAAGDDIMVLSRHQRACAWWRSRGRLA